MNRIKKFISVLVTTTLCVLALLPQHRTIAIEDEDGLTRGSIKGVTIKNVSSNSGRESTSRFFYNVYLKKGEILTLDAEFVSISSSVSGTQSAEGYYSIVSPDGVVGTLDYPKGIQLSPTEFEKDSELGTTTTQIVADMEGVYVIKPVQTYIEKATSFNLTFTVQEDLQSPHISGRVWSDILELEQWAGKNTTTGEFKYPEDYEFYHMTADGYLFKQQLFGYHGITSQIYSDPVGTLDVSNTNCEAVYFDTPGTATTIFKALQAVPDCSNRILQNHVFLEMPDSNLPEFGTTAIVDAYGQPLKESDGSVSTKEIFVVSRLENNEPTFNDFMFERNHYTSNAGDFSFNVKNHSGYVSIEISLDFDQDGVTDDVVVGETLVNQNGTETVYKWDGKDSNGIDVPLTADISAELVIRRSGEIHFISNDLETREGMTVTQLTALEDVNINNSVLSYDGTQLPIDWAKAMNIHEPTPNVGSYDSALNPTHRGWKQVSFNDNVADGDSRNTYAPRLSDYEGIPENGEALKNVRSYGDGNYMDEWMFEVTDIRAKIKLEIMDTDVTIHKSVDKSVAEVGDILTYTLIVENNNDYDLENLVVLDTLNDMDKVAYVANSIKVDGVLVTDEKDSDNGSFVGDTVEVLIPFLSHEAKENTATITFSVLVKEAAAGEIIYNKARIVDPIDETVEHPSNEVETEILFASLSATKTVKVNGEDQDYTQNKDTLTYEILVSNTGTLDVKGIKVQDTLQDIANKATVEPIGLVTVVSKGNEYQYTLEDLINGSIYIDVDAGSSVSITFSIRVTNMDEDVHNLTNIAVITPPGETPFTPEVELEVKHPFIQIEKMVDASIAHGGDILTYTLNITNTGDADATDWIVNDTIQNMSYVSYVQGTLTLDGSKLNDTDHFINDTFTIPLDRIAVGETRTLTFKVIVEQAAKGQTILNRATIHDSEDPTKEVPSNEVKTDVVYSELVAQKTVRDASGDALVQNGETLTYTICVTNVGNEIAKNVRIQDPFEMLLKHATLTNASVVKVSMGTSISNYTLADLIQGLIYVDIPANEQVKVEVEITLDKIDQTINVLVNQAIVTPEDDEPLYPEASIDVEISEAPDVPELPATGLMDMRQFGLMVGITGSLLLILERLIRKSRKINN